MGNSVLEIPKTYALYIKYRARAFSFAWATLIGVLVATRGIPPFLPTIGVLTASSTISLSIYILNDMMDLDIDRINKVDRPLAQGKISTKATLAFVLTLTVIGALTGFLINFMTFVLCIVGIAVGFTYSTRPVQLKNRFMLKQTAIASGAFISSVTGGAAVGSLSWSVLFAGLMFFAYAFAMSPIVDLGDIRGDAIGGRKTLPVTLGPQNTVKTAIIFMFLLVASSIIGFFKLGFNLALPILVSLFCLLCACFLYPLLNRWQDFTFVRMQVKKWIFIHFMIQLTILIGAFPMPI